MNSAAAIRLVVFDFAAVSLEHCTVPAHQAVFVDDDNKFIQGAISTGMHGPPGSA